MQKTLHRITERGVFEIPDYDYIKKNSPVDLNRCDSILLSGENKDGSATTNSNTLKNLEAITGMDSGTVPNTEETNTNPDSELTESTETSSNTSSEEKLVRPQSGVLDTETSKVIENPTYVEIPR